MNEPKNQPITNAVYGKKAAVKKAPAKPARKPRGTFVGEVITPQAVAALVALRDELQAKQDAKKKRARK